LVSSATRWRRLLAAQADSVFEKFGSGRTLELGRSRRSIMRPPRRRIGHAHGVRFGLALHLGEVLYGNIGSGNRLDFTCIGPAVNLAARLEKLAASLGRTIILSAEFAQHSRVDLEPLGEFAVAGFAAAQRTFGLRAGSAVKPAGGDNL
jgi:adenylate cyclase